MSCSCHLTLTLTTLKGFPSSRVPPKKSKILYCDCNVIWLFSETILFSLPLQKCWSQEPSRLTFLHESLRLKLFFLNDSFLWQMVIRTPREEVWGALLERNMSHGTELKSPTCEWEGPLHQSVKVRLQLTLA